MSKENSNITISIDSEWFLDKYEQELREQLAKEIEEAPHHHNMLDACDGCKDKKFYAAMIRG